MHVKVLDEQVVERAKARGLDVLVYAPHFVRLPDIRERAREFSDEELLVVPGREIFTGDWRNRRHVLAIGLEDPVPDFITLDGAMGELARQGAAVLAPHPEFLNVSLGRGDLRTWAGEIDAVEAYNPKLLGHWADRARSIVRRDDWAPFGSSYAHLRRSIGEVWTTFERRLDSEAELVDALTEGAAREVGRQRGVGHRARCLAEFAHLGYENSWSKIDRLFLSGTEPTHPRHIAYEGRFDDVAVY
ncbi:PHP-associated domain-containing protein [Haloarchaeobius amylolyticus]|uniref:PHP-associated domain-containing protein n=1 Tax=Haloarchaeobius amylolyticus TaxID=1198296 RepID=UPI0026E55CC8|nr:PHP-associated domain-containing protein [Haloarchaeobius amylolyticus]